MTALPGEAPKAEWPAIERRKLGWARDWQAAVEREKAALARSLHDDTGGLLIAAVMDISWAENHLQDASGGVAARLARAHAALDSVIDLNRRMIEDLRPTLLDNFGLVPALRWHLAEICKCAQIRCEAHLPDPAPNFSSPAAIALYRVTQVLVSEMVTHHAQAITLRLEVEASVVLLTLQSEGVTAEFNAQAETLADVVASVTGRARTFGGDVHFQTHPGRVVVTCRMACLKALVADPT